MKKKAMPRDILAVTLTSFYLVLYCAFLQFEATRFIALLMLGFAPVILTAMVLTVLILGKYKGPELGNDEFGYADKSKDKLGTF